MAQLRALYPAVRVHNAGRNYNYFYGTQMTSGQTEAQAAANFLNQHGAVFGGPLTEGRPELAEQWNMPSRDGTFVAFAYQQKIRGKDVDGSIIRVKVRRGEMPRVDYAAARLAGEPTVGSETPILPSEVAVVTVRSLSGVQGLVVEESPEVVALRGDARRADAWCWRVKTREGEGMFSKKRTYYVDTAAPRIVHTRNHFWGLQPPTTGTVEGAGVVAAPPWHPYKGTSTTLVNHRIPAISVQGTVGGSTESVYTNANGEFVLSSGSSGQSIAVNASFSRYGQWHRMNTTDVTPNDFLSESASTVVGHDIPLTLGSSNSLFTQEMRVAQVDAVIGASRCRDFWTQYISSSTFILGLRPNYTGAASSCASAGGSSGVYGAAFAPSNVARWNCASHSAIAHEFGHCALDFLGIDFNDQPGFHEGFGDIYATMVNDDSVIGPSQWVNGDNTRDDPTSTHLNCQFPLTQYTSHSYCKCYTQNESYNPVPLISGVWVRIRTGMKTYYGASTGLEHARVLFGDWCLITAGGDDSCQGLHPASLVEVLSLPQPGEDDGIVEASFAAHNICVNGACDE